MDEGIVLRENERSLYMNPVDKDVKNLFFEIAKQYHTDHYGNCLKWLIDQALEYQKVKEIILNQDFINHILGDKSQIETPQEETPQEETKPETKKIRMLNGKIKEVRKNE